MGVILSKAMATAGVIALKIAYERLYENDKPLKRIAGGNMRVAMMGGRDVQPAKNPMIAYKTKIIAVEG